VFSEQHDPRVSRPLLPLAAPSATETVTHDAGAGANRRTVPPLRPAQSADQRNARSDTALTGGDEVWPRRAETNADATRTASDRVKASFGISKDWEINSNNTVSVLCHFLSCSFSDIANYSKYEFLKISRKWLENGWRNLN
jgi:hypothetical protein